MHSVFTISSALKWKIYIMIYPFVVSRVNRKVKKKASYSEDSKSTRTGTDRELLLNRENN